MAAALTAFFNFAGLRPAVIYAIVAAAILFAGAVEVPTVNDQVITEAALAIYAAFVREPDPERARRRFVALQPAIREQYRREAMAAGRIFEAALRHGEFA